MPFLSVSVSANETPRAKQNNDLIMEASNQYFKLKLPTTYIMTLYANNETTNSIKSVAGPK